MFLPSCPSAGQPDPPSLARPANQQIESRIVSVTSADTAGGILLATVVLVTPPRPRLEKSKMTSSHAIDNGPVWPFCRDGFYFGNIFEYRESTERTRRT